VLYRRGYGMASLEYGVPMSPRVVSEIGSVSKQFTAAAVLLLARDGLLSLDDDVRQHIPELGIEEPLTLRRLADHTSGLRDWIGLMGLVGRPWGEVIHTVPEITDLIARQRTLNFAPGERYLYSNAGYTLLLEVVERVSGRSFAELTAERIFEPLGMEHTEWRDDHARIVRNRAAAHRPTGNGGFRTQMPYSDAIGSGGLISSVDDMIRWTEALHSGEFGGPGFLEEMTRVGVLTDGREIHYALGLQLADFRGVPEVAHGGATAGYRAYLAHYPEDRLTVALQCNVTAVNSGGLARSVAEIFLADRLAPEAEVVDPRRTPYPPPSSLAWRGSTGIRPPSRSSPWRWRTGSSAPVAPSACG
jgi:CubicO group peptidase (beta-lactamase class C family)